MRGLLSFVAAAATLVWASPAPDNHDRALAARLDAGVQTLRQLAKPGGSSPDLTPKNCAALRGGTDKTFEAAILVTPVLVGELVHEHKAQLVAVQQTIDSIHPDSPLFARWVAALRKSFAQTLQFDTRGKKIDLCQAATVMLDKGSTAADWRRVVGFGPDVFAQAFNNKANATLTNLDPRMRAFFIAAGLSRQHAATLTSGSF